MAAGFVLRQQFKGNAAVKNKSSVVMIENNRPAIVPTSSVHHFNGWCEKFAALVTDNVPSKNWEPIVVGFDDTETPVWFFEVTVEHIHDKKPNGVVFTTSQTARGTVPFHSSVREVAEAVTAALETTRAMVRRMVAAELAAN